MLNTKSKINTILMLIILSIILITIAIFLWIFLSDGDRQQDKTYSGAKLVKQIEYNISEWEIL